MLELPFRYVVIADFEFEFGGHASADDAGRSGERPRPVCMVAKELRSGQTWRLWRGQFGSTPPFPTGPDSLFVAFYASAELGCFRALGWPKPSDILDLFVEFRDRTNGLATPAWSMKRKDIGGASSSRSPSAAICVPLKPSIAKFSAC